MQTSNPRFICEWWQCDKKKEVFIISMRVYSRWAIVLLHTLRIVSIFLFRYSCQRGDWIKSRHFYLIRSNKNADTAIYWIDRKTATSDWFKPCKIIIEWWRKLTAQIKETMARTRNIFSIQYKSECIISQPAHDSIIYIWKWRLCDVIC